MNSRMAHPIRSSDTYDVYFRNPALIPPRNSPPADYAPAEVWTLDKSRGPATVDDICDFIVEYVNSDVMVRSSWTLTHTLNSGPHPIARVYWHTGTSSLQTNLR